MKAPEAFGRKKYREIYTILLYDNLHVRISKYKSIERNIEDDSFHYGYPFVDIYDLFIDGYPNPVQFM